MRKNRKVNPNPSRVFAQTMTVRNDYSWLWAIRTNWSSDYEETTPKTSRSLENLKVALLQKSDQTNFEFWKFNSTYHLWLANESVELVPRVEGLSWAEAITVASFRGESVFNLVAVVKASSDDLAHRSARMTVFEHPDDVPLNSVLEELIQLQGREIRWKYREMANFPGD